MFDGAASPDRAKVIEATTPRDRQGDADRGKAVFAKRAAPPATGSAMSASHVGPDLAALANRTPAYLMQEILDPNRNLDSRYVEYQAQLNGRPDVTGLLAAETATTIILRGQQRKEDTLLRPDIDELRRVRQVAHARGAGKGPAEEGHGRPARLPVGRPPAAQGRSPATRRP